MKSRSLYHLNGNLSKKDFALKIVKAIEKHPYIFDIYSLKIGDIDLQYKEAIVVYGKSQFNYVCSTGKKTHLGGNTVMAYHPEKGEIDTTTEMVLSFGKILPNNEKNAIIDSLANSKKAKSTLVIDDKYVEKYKNIIKKQAFEENFKSKGQPIKNLSLSGDAVIEAVDVVEIPVLSCTLTYKDITIKAECMAFDSLEPSIEGLDKIPSETEERVMVYEEPSKGQTAIKVFNFIMIIPFLASFVGFYIGIRNIAKDWPACIIGFSICGIGFLLMCIYAIIIMIRRSVVKKYKEGILEEHRRIKQLQLNELIETIKRMED